MKKKPGRKKKPRTVGERIRAVRGDMSQMEFADEIMIQQANVSQYENDIRIPSVKVLLRIAQFSGTSIEWLLAGTETTDRPVAPKPRLKVKRRKSRQELLNLAAEEIRSTKFRDAEEFCNMMQDLFKNRRKMKKVLAYYQHMKSEG